MVMLVVTGLQKTIIAMKSVGRGMEEASKLLITGQNWLSNVTWQFGLFSFFLKLHEDSLNINLSSILQRHNKLLIRVDEREILV